MYSVTILKCAIHIRIRYHRSGYVNRPLANAERYITQELKEYEEKILGAEDKILILETQLYMELVQALSEFIPAIQVNANQIARLDCLLSFANVARENNYIRPVIEDNDVLDIRQGRHPVIEATSHRREVHCQ